MEWKTVKLGEITVGGKGSYGIGAPAVDFNPLKYTYLRITDINDDGTINYAGLKSVDDPEAYKYILKPNDIVFARTGATTGRTYFYLPQDGTFVYAGFLIKFSIDPKKANPRLLKYITHSQEYYDWVRSFDTGGTRGNINAKTFADMPLCLPDRASQDKIVSILSSLDDKIENNNRINRNLEAQAQALFKSWFVDFEPWGGTMPEDWKEGVLSDIADITMGQSPRGESYNTQGEGVIFYQGCSDFGDRFPSVRMFTTEPARYAVPNSILMSVRAPVGTMNVALEECCIGRGLASLKEKNSYDSFLLYLLESLQNVFDSYNGDGTVFGSINKKSIGNIKIVIPSIKVVESFHKMVSPLDEKIKFNQRESHRLAALRDTLLPKLIRGEITL